MVLPSNYIYRKWKNSDLENELAIGGDDDNTVMSPVKSKQPEGCSSEYVAICKK